METGQRTMPVPRHNLPTAKQKPLDTTRKAPPAAGTHITTAVNLRRPLWRLLRAVAFKRAQITGARPSVSALLNEILEAHRGALERELK